MTHSSEPGKSVPTFGEYYHAVASTMALYQMTAHRLVELAELKPGMRVLDLASGSGLAAAAALEAVPEGLTLYLLDKSPSMIAEARKRLGDKVAEYFTADALSVAGLIQEPVDRVLINMSLWQFARPEETLREVRKVMKPTGRLCFNMINTYFNTDRVVVSPYWALMQTLFERGELPQRPQLVDRLPNQRSIEGNLGDAGFKPFHFDVTEIPSAVPDTQRGGELWNLLRLSPLPGLKEPERVFELLKEVAADVAAQEPHWRVAYFMAQPALTPDEILETRLKGTLGPPRA